jgi:hypothetical protein
MNATSSFGEEPPLPGANIDSGAMVVLLQCAEQKKRSKESPALPVVEEPMSNMTDTVTPVDSKVEKRITATQAPPQLPPADIFRRCSSCGAPGTEAGEAAAPWAAEQSAQAPKEAR